MLSSILINEQFNLPGDYNQDQDQDQDQQQAPSPEEQYSAVLTTLKRDYLINKIFKFRSKLQDLGVDTILLDTLIKYIATIPYDVLVKIVNELILVYYNESNKQEKK